MTEPTQRHKDIRGSEKPADNQQCAESVEFFVQAEETSDGLLVSPPLQQIPPGMPGQPDSTECTKKVRLPRKGDEQDLKLIRGNQGEQSLEEQVGSVEAEHESGVSPDMTAGLQEKTAAETAAERGSEVGREERSKKVRVFGNAGNRR